jgi:hypothetical protein
VEVVMANNNKFEMGEGKKQVLESVLPEDVDKIGKLNKDCLAGFAWKKFGYKLNLLKHITVLRGELVMKALVALGTIAEDEYCDEETRIAIEKVIPRFLKHPVNGRINPATPQLLKRGDLIPCTEDGKILRSHEYYIPEDKPVNNPNSKQEMERIAAGMERQIV